MYHQNVLIQGQEQFTLMTDITGHTIYYLVTLEVMKWLARFSGETGGMTSNE